MNGRVAAIGVLGVVAMFEELLTHNLLNRAVPDAWVQVLAAAGVLV